MEISVNFKQYSIYKFQLRDDQWKVSLINCFDNIEFLFCVCNGNGIQPPCGTILYPSDPTFAEEILIDNERFQSTRSPSILVIAKCEADIQFAISLAQKEHLPFSVLVGGHSAVGYSLIHCGLVVSLKYMNQMSLDQSTNLLSIQGRRNLVTNLLLFTIDRCDTALFIGWRRMFDCWSRWVFDGWWLSYLSRMYGTGSDNLVEATIVLANGSVITTNQNSHQIFSGRFVVVWWEFGVITQVIIKVYQTDSYVGDVTWLAQILLLLLTKNQCITSKYQLCAIFSNQNAHFVKANNSSICANPSNISYIRIV